MKKKCEKQMLTGRLFPFLVIFLSSPSTSFPRLSFDVWSSVAFYYSSLSPFRSFLLSKDCWFEKVGAGDRFEIGAVGAGRVRLENVTASSLEGNQSCSCSDGEAMAMAIATHFMTVEVESKGQREGEWPLGPSLSVFHSPRQFLSFTKCFRQLHDFRFRN